jgi:hypothetical protein
MKNSMKFRCNTQTNASAGYLPLKQGSAPGRTEGKKWTFVGLPCGRDERPSSPPPLEHPRSDGGARQLVANAGAGCVGCGGRRGPPRGRPVVGETRTAEGTRRRVVQQAEWRGPGDEGDGGHRQGPLGFVRAGLMRGWVGEQRREEGRAAAWFRHGRMRDYLLLINPQISIKCRLFGSTPRLHAQYLYDWLEITRIC